MHLGLHLTVLGLSFALARVAEAGEKDTPVARESQTTSSASSVRTESPAPEYEDYRLTLFGTDVAAISLLVLAGFTSENESVSSTFVVTGIGTYALGGPIVHWSHGQRGRSLESFGLRVGLPAFGILLGVAGASGCGEGEDNDLCVVGAVAVGGLIAGVGALTAMIIDDGFLGRFEKTPPEKAAGGAGFVSVGLAPLFDTRKKTLGLSLVGVF